MTLHNVRWAACLTCVVLGVGVCVLNALWKLRARSPRMDGHRPSTVPFVAPGFGFMAAWACPDPRGWWILPVMFAIDVGTLGTMWALLRMLRSGDS
jgi:hypothetical protein